MTTDNIEPFTRESIADPKTPRFRIEFLMNLTPLISTVVTTCGLVGPFAAATIDASRSFQTGTLTPGDQTWQFGIFGNWAAGLGVGASVSLGSNGSLTYANSVSGGGAAGGGVMVCKQVTGSCSGGR